MARASRHQKWSKSLGSSLRGSQACQPRIWVRGLTQMEGWTSTGWRERGERHTGAAHSAAHGEQAASCSYSTFASTICRVEYEGEGEGGRPVRKCTRLLKKLRDCGRRAPGALLVAGTQRGRAGVLRPPLHSLHDVCGCCLTAVLRAEAPRWWRWRPWSWPTTTWVSWPIRTGSFPRPTCGELLECTCSPKGT